MSMLSTIELQKEYMKFSVAHFTIFSATERETLHGHNYTVFSAFTTLVEDNGLSFDYRYYKEKLFHLCRELNQSCLLPTESNYLQIREEGDFLYAEFNGETIPFLKKDVTLVPISNITVEELSGWFVSKLSEDKTVLAQHNIKEIV